MCVRRRYCGTTGSTRPVSADIALPLSVPVTFGTQQYTTIEHSMSSPVRATVTDNECYVNCPTPRIHKRPQQHPQEWNIQPTREREGCSKTRRLVVSQHAQVVHIDIHTPDTPSPTSYQPLTHLSTKNAPPTSSGPVTPRRSNRAGTEEQSSRASRRFRCGTRGASGTGAPSRPTQNTCQKPHG